MNKTNASVEELDPQKAAESKLAGIDSNIFIIGGVASWKTELTNDLSRGLWFLPIDSGKLFRYAAYLLLQDTEFNAINPDFNLLKSKNQEEIDRIQKITYNKTRLLERNELQEVTFIKNNKDQTELHINHSLETPIIDALVPIIAKLSNVRRVIWQWIEKLSERHGKIILTGHNLKETDTTDYQVIHLLVDDTTAGDRLLRRSRGYSDVEEAIESVKRRNELDGFIQTSCTLKRVHNVIGINTVNLSIPEVTESVLRILNERQMQKKTAWIFYETTAIARNDFHWRKNPVMSVLRTHLEYLFQNLTIPSGVDQFDLLMQCLLHLPAFSKEELFGEDKPEKSSRIINHPLIAWWVTTEVFWFSPYAIEERILPTISKQIERLKMITWSRNNPSFKDSQKLDFPPEFSLSLKWNRDYFQWPICRHLSIELFWLWKNITFKPCSEEQSNDLSLRKHYLHTPRLDEFMSFGAFIEWIDTPIAWVSYSLHDRAYKMELLQHIWIEPHNTLEMTRAWNHPLAPKNLMSLLFSYAYEELRSIWTDLQKDGYMDKQLSAITTTINPNLWFKGGSFFGSNFSVFALRPATLNYKQVWDKLPEYTTRRNIFDWENWAVFSEAKIVQLPLNEMIICYNHEDLRRISSGPVFQMKSSTYNKI